MNRREFIGAAGTLAIGLGLSGAALAAGPGGKLPAVAGLGAKTLDQALRARQSTREYADKPPCPRPCWPTCSGPPGG